jgi:DNA-binding response OmpR family regulator
MKKQILLVEDTVDLRINLSELLKMEDYLVFESQNGEEAMLMLENINPHLIITDLLMPKMNGFDFIQNVRKNPKWKNVQIIAFSAMPAQENEKKVLELGANVYLKKPSTLDALIDVVNKLLNQ